LNTRGARVLMVWVLAVSRPLHGGSLKREFPRPGFCGAPAGRSSPGKRLQMSSSHHGPANNSPAANTHTQTILAKRCSGRLQIRRQIPTRTSPPIANRKPVAHPWKWRRPCHREIEVVPAKYDPRPLQALPYRLTNRHLQSVAQPTPLACLFQNHQELSAGNRFCQGDDRRCERRHCRWRNHECPGQSAPARGNSRWQNSPERKPPTHTGTLPFRSATAIVPSTP